MTRYRYCKDFSELLNKTFDKVEQQEISYNDAIIFENSGKSKYAIFHSQDCCESVYIEDICGDLNDLVGSPITQAESIASNEEPKEKYHESYTWTFIKLATNKGSVTIRFYGSSNGYYGESADLYKAD